MLLFIYIHVKRVLIFSKKGSFTPLLVEIDTVCYN